MWPYRCSTVTVFVRSNCHFENQIRNREFVSFMLRFKFSFYVLMYINSQIKVKTANRRLLKVRGTDGKGKPRCRPVRLFFWGHVVTLQVWYVTSQTHVLGRWVGVWDWRYFWGSIRGKGRKSSVNTWRNLRMRRERSFGVIRSLERYGRILHTHCSSQNCRLGLKPNPPQVGRRRPTIFVISH